MWLEHREGQNEGTRRLGVVGGRVSRALWSAGRTWVLTLWRRKLEP